MLIRHAMRHEAAEKPKKTRRRGRGRKYSTKFLGSRNSSSIRRLRARSSATRSGSPRGGTAGRSFLVECDTCVHHYLSIWQQVSEGCLATVLVVDVGTQWARVIFVAPIESIERRDADNLPALC